MTNANDFIVLIRNYMEEKVSVSQYLIWKPNVENKGAGHVHFFSRKIQRGWCYKRTVTMQFYG